MSGKIWRFSCCQKRKSRGPGLSRSTRKDNEVAGASLQTDGSVEHVHEHYENGSQCERPERPSQDGRDGAPAEQKRATGTEDQGDEAHDPNTRKEGVTLNGFELKALLNFVGKVDGCVVPPPEEQQQQEEEKAYRLVRVQLETVQKEKVELEAQVVQAKRSVRDLRHEIAVLQKRLQVAENRLPNPPPPPPPPPPPAQPLVNPLRALLTIIQKSRNSRDPNVCLVQDVGLLPQSPVHTDAPHNHQCPGMNQVLEMIRGGVSLRHVIQVHKGTFRAEGDGSDVGGQPVPELHRILRKRKVSADKHVSDGSCDGSVEEDHSGDAPSSMSSPRESPLHDPHAGEDPPQDTREAAGEKGDGPSDGDAVSTVSTLPLAAPLDQGQVQLAGVPPCPEGAAPSPPSRGASGQPPMEGRASPTNLEGGLKVVPADRPATGGTPQPSSSPNSTARYLNWEKWSDVDLRTALPLKSIFKSVSFMASGGDVEEGDDGQQNQPPRRRESSSPTASESDRGCQSLGSADFGEVFPDLPEDERAEFAALHRALKPPPSSSEGCQGQDALRPNFEESAGGPETGGLLPETRPAPGGAAIIRSGTGDSHRPEEAERLCTDACRLPAAFFPSAAEEDRDYHQMVFRC